MASAVLLGFAPPMLGAEPRASVPAAPEGALVIVGGGSLPDSVRDRFLDLAGGKVKARLVVIPTASEKASATKVFRSLAYWKEQGVESLSLLHTLDRKEANDPVFVKPLTVATGVWLAGGDQDRLTTAYRGTLVEKELHKLLSRGGVIGGTSAGASAMSGVMITGGNPIASVGNGFGFLPEVVIDQHFQNRHRLDRLLGVLTRHPTCLGLGIDEQTAVVVKGHLGTVMGAADVRVCLPAEEGKTPSVQVLKAGQALDLQALSRTVLSRARSHAGKSSGGTDRPKVAEAGVPRVQ